MLSVLFAACAIWAGVLLVLTFSFDVWVYLSSKDFDFVLHAWMNRHKTLDPRLSHRQAMLLRTVSLAERSLGYFGLIVVIPLYAFFIIYRS